MGGRAWSWDPPPVAHGDAARPSDAPRPRRGGLKWRHPWSRRTIALRGCPSPRGSPGPLQAARRLG
eukprot:4988595-Lingulodinium_polyedra.AAC.1